MGFERLAGQESITGVLRNSIAQGNLAHAVLFAGPDGSGKSTLALLVAGALNCTGEPVPCEECISCRNVMKGQHPDVAFVEQDGRRIKIDQIREVKKKFFYFAHGRGKRVCLIDDAHNLTAEAAASLLKILEDPPDGLIFILTTAYPSRLPATILSRCQHYRMKRLSNEMMRELLKEIKPDVTEEELDLAVNQGEGIPGRARDIMLNEEWAKRRELVYELGKKLVTGDITERELLAEAKEWTDRKDLGQLMELFSFFMRDGLFWNLCRDPGMLSDAGLKSFWEHNIIDAAVMKECLEILNNTRKMIQTNVSLVLAVETVFLQIRGRFKDV